MYVFMSAMLRNANFLVKCPPTVLSDVRAAWRSVVSLADLIQLHVDEKLNNGQVYNSIA